MGKERERLYLESTNIVELIGLYSSVLFLSGVLIFSGRWFYFHFLDSSLFMHLTAALAGLFVFTSIRALLATWQYASSLCYVIEVSQSEIYSYWGTKFLGKRMRKLTDVLDVIIYVQDKGVNYAVEEYLQRKSMDELLADDNEFRLKVILKNREEEFLLFKVYDMKDAIKARAFILKEPTENTLKQLSFYTKLDLDKGQTEEDEKQLTYERYSNWVTKKIPVAEIGVFLFLSWLIILIITCLFPTILISTLLIFGLVSLILYGLDRFIKTNKIVITPSKIKIEKIRLVKIEEKEIERYNVAFISVTARLVDNQYTIIIVSQSGAIHELPIAFESEVAAEVAVVQMKQLMKLE